MTLAYTVPVIIYLMHDLAEFIIGRCCRGRYDKIHTILTYQYINQL